IFPGHTVQSYVAVQEWFKVDEALPYFTAIFDPRLTDFYAWTIPKEDYLLLGAALPVRQDPLQGLRS
ncbi:MAG: oxidoreductase, partial [Bacillota bacterium]